MITLLIVDDHQIVRWGIRTFFATQADILVVGEASSGEEALQVVADLAPDIVLMDLVLPGMDGVEATRRLKQISPHTQVMVLTSYHEDEHLFPAIQAGALSYLLKDVGTSELADAVRKAAHGEAMLHPGVAADAIPNFV
jgi:NarL family two-component system response regulator LiaR